MVTDHCVKKLEDGISETIPNILKLFFTGTKRGHPYPNQCHHSNLHFTTSPDVDVGYWARSCLHAGIQLVKVHKQIGMSLLRAGLIILIDTVVKTYTIHDSHVYQV